MTKKPRITLEALFTSPIGFGIETASPAQRAVCRIVQGLPLEELGEDPDVKQMLGYHTCLDPCPPPNTAPREIILISGIRTAKSMLAAAIAIVASQTCDVSKLSPGDVPRFSILSLDKDKADVVLNHLLGAINSSPALRGLLIDKPKADGLFLRHPSGRPIEIKVVAGARAGGSLVARWSAGCVFDEALRMTGDNDDGVVNWEDGWRAVRGRLLPGAQIISISSPWAPKGALYERINKYWGKPSKQVVVLRAPGPVMNPYYFTPELVEELKRTDDGFVYRTDVLGEFADPEANLFPTALIEASTRVQPIHHEPNPLNDYVAAMDPATRGDAWSFVIATRVEGKRVVVFNKAWQGNSLAPLSPDAVLREIALICSRYFVDTVETDQFCADALRDIATRYNLNLVITPLTQSNKLQLFENMRTWMHEGQIELPPDKQVREDLQAVKKRLMPGGSISIVFPRKKTHADYAPALAMVLRRYVEEPRKVELDPYSTDGQNEEARRRKLDVSHRGAYGGGVNGEHMYGSLMGADATFRHNPEDTPWWETTD